MQNYVAGRALASRFLLVSAAGLIGCGMLVDSSATKDGVGGPAGADGGSYLYDPFAGPYTSVPRAECGPGSQPETGLQGQVPNEDRTSGRSQQGYSCNLEVVGQYRQGDGASWQMATYEDCAYYGTLYSDGRQTQLGAVVVDASDPVHPVKTTVLDTPAVMDPHESLKVNGRRGLLAAVELAGGGSRPEGDDYFDIYDVSGDCAHPVLKASVALPGTAGHEGDWAPDGLTYYGTDTNALGGPDAGSVNAIDVADPASPRLLHQFPYAVHGLTFSEDGQRGYYALIGAGPSGRPTGTLPSPAPLNGFMILDVSQIQNRVPNPQVRILSELFWPGLIAGQETNFVTFRGKPYVIYVEEGLGILIIDVSDDFNPKVVSTIRLEVHVPENIPMLAAETANYTALYISHYCGVDRVHDPTIAACGFTQSGIRVFDIRDLYLPREIAYFNPPALAGVFPGAATGGDTADACTAQVRIVPERGELWTTCNRNEFLILRFTNGVWPFKD